jgi:UDP-perosamine 4-acetyltransferase
MKQIPGVIVIGAGGHAKVCIEILRAAGFCVDYCVGGDDSPQTCLGIPVLTGDEHLAMLAGRGYSRAFVAVGANATRERLAEVALALGYALLDAISPHAVISPSAKLGRGIAVMPGAVIQAEADIGDLAIINTASSVDHDCTIQKAAHIGPGCVLAGNVAVGPRCLLGAGTTVIPGVSIGSDAVVGAGGVVISDIAAGATAVGVPARIIKP